MKKKLLIALTAATLLASFPLTVYAGEWQQDSTGFWYLNDDGTKPVDTWKLIDNNWYYFKSNGYMNTGWINVSGQWYYCEPTGQMRTTELPTDVFTFQFNADGTCSNFYKNTTPSTQAGWANYGTSSLSSFANAIAAGNIVYYNGSYWATPDYTSSLKNQQVVSQPYVPQHTAQIVTEQDVINKYTMQELQFSECDVHSMYEDNDDTDRYDLDGYVSP